VIRQEKNGSWRVELYDPHTKRKFRVRPSDWGYETPKTEQAARKLEAIARAGQELNPNMSLADGPMTVARYADLFTSRAFNHKGHEITPQTNAHYAGQLKKFLAAYGTRTIQSISVPEAMQFALDPQTRGTAREVKAMFRSALREQIIDKDPFAGVQINQRVSRPKEFLRLPTVRSLIEAARMVYPDWPDFAALIEWLAGTGKRPGEGAGAQWDYFDVENLRYDVQWQYHGKRRQLVRPKHNSVGMIFVFDWAAEAVADLPRHPDGFMFHNRKGRPMDAATISTAFAGIRHLAGAGRATAGALRHFHASYLLNELGLPVYTVAQQLRHSSTELVEKTYGHPDRALHLERIAKAASGTRMGEGEGASVDL
jgi:integrase